ncbi:hypothetical protein [Parafilimonas sp.]|uniref:hypothetical protein n=1 Tax=Parafilimonas sp. TaxID=1969739 RepID=UPI0039E22BA7
MSDIPSFSYDILWEEKRIQSVANLTRKDGEGFLKLAAGVNTITEAKLFRLHEANEALQELQQGKFAGAAVLVMSG